MRPWIAALLALLVAPALAQQLSMSMSTVHACSSGR